MKRLLLFGLLWMLAACDSGGGQISIPVQHWNDVDVRIETHPNPPLPGMSDVVVIATGPRGRPVSDLTIYLRGDETLPWVQAIQDGFIGVYRRAVDLGNGNKAVIRVKIQQGEREKILEFPVTLSVD